LNNEPVDIPIFRRLNVYFAAWQHGSLKRESLWTNNLAVGSRQYIEQNQQKFGRQYKIKVLLAPSFKVQQYGQIRANNDLSPRENGHAQGYAINEPKLLTMLIMPLKTGL